jgi:hypothetical protein
MLSEFHVDNVVPNPSVTGEGGRAILNRLATKELILSIDSDNYLVGRDWLRRLIAPLMADPSVFAAEPMRWDYALTDPPLNRYFALTGINDPVSLFMRNYGRYSYLTGTWTGVVHNEEHADGYLIAELQPGHVPTMGANGFLARADVVRSVSYGQYYFDIDVVNVLVAQGHTRIAKVDVALGHRFADDLTAFKRKTRRRVEDFLYWRDERKYPWLAAGKTSILRFALATLLVLPLFWQVYKGFCKVRDFAWLYHIPVCWLTLWLYGRAVVRSAVRRAPHSRHGWQQ